MGLPLQILTPNNLKEFLGVRRIGSPHFIMCLIAFNSNASFSAISPILALYAKEIVGASILEVGLFVSIFFMASAVSKVPFGILAGGKRSVLIFLLGLIIFASCPVAYVLFPDINFLILFRALHGFSYTIIFIMSLTLASLTVPSIEKDAGVGTYSASLSLGLMAGPAVSSVGVSLLGIRNTFNLAAILGFLGVFPTFFLVRKLYAVEDQWLLMVEEVDKREVTGKIYKVLKNKVFDVAFLSNFAFFFLFGVILTYLPIYAKESLGFSGNYISILFFLYYSLSTIIRFILSKILSKVKKDLLLLLSSILTVALTLFMMMVKAPIPYTVAFILVGVGQGIIYPVGAMMVSEATGPRELVLANSVFMAALDLGIALAPISTSPIAIYYGIPYTFALSALISTVIVIVNAYLCR